VSTTAETVTVLIGGLAAGGTFTAALQAFSQRRRVPVEVENLSVEGAQQAVASLMQSLEAETARANRNEDLVREKDRRIEQLECRIDTLQTMLDDLRSDLHSIKSKS
jgi:esterase/lipase